MKTHFIHPLTLLCLVFIVQACGPSTEESLLNEREARDAAIRLQHEEVMIAEALEMIKSQSRAIARGEHVRLPNNIAEYTIDVDADETPVPTEETPTGDTRIATSAAGSYTIQVASLNTQNKASSELETWKQRGFNDAFISQNNNHYRVRLGRYNSRENALQEAARVKSDFNTAAWVDVIGEAPSTELTGTFTVQISAVNSQTIANREINKWKERGFSDVYSQQIQLQGSTVYRIRVGNFNNREEALKLSSRINEEYNKASIVFDI